MIPMLKQSASISGDERPASCSVAIPQLSQGVQSRSSSMLLHIPNSALSKSSVYPSCQKARSNVCNAQFYILTRYRGPVSGHPYLLPRALSRMSIRRTYPMSRDFVASLPVTLDILFKLLKRPQRMVQNTRHRPFLRVFLEAKT
jgi:hypothetical protein